MEDAQGIALGVLGISLIDLDLLSIADIYRALHWKQYYEKQTVEMMYRNSWEQTRILAGYIAAPNMKTKLKKFSDLFPFEWDENAGPKIGTDEWKAQAEEIRRRIEEKEKQNNG